ncbi:hypothetical protein [Microvirga rosea]|nr:hypothetical protein [Microvirga rosea]
MAALLQDRQFCCLEKQFVIKLCASAAMVVFPIKAEQFFRHVPS